MAFDQDCERTVGAKTVDDLVQQPDISESRLRTARAEQQRPADEHRLCVPVEVKQPKQA